MRPASLVPLQRLWRRLPSGKHAGLWPLLLAAPILIALLLAFHAVVRGAVLQGEEQRAAVAAHAVASWRCTRLPTALQLDDSRAALERGCGSAAIPDAESRCGRATHAGRLSRQGICQRNLS